MHVSFAIHPKAPQSLVCEAISEQKLIRTPNSPIGTVTLQRSFLQIERSQEPKSTWEFGFTSVTGALQLELNQSQSANTSDAAAASEYDEAYDMYGSVPHHMETQSSAH